MSAFAARLAYSQYGWLKRQVMRWIVRREGGDVDTSRDYECTDGDQVEQLARGVFSLVRAAATSGGHSV